MNDLALQVADVDHVEVDESDGPDARGREIHRRRRAQPACADAEHARGLQPLLAFYADLGQHQVAAVALELARVSSAATILRRSRSDFTRALFPWRFATSFA